MFARTDSIRIDPAYAERLRAFGLDSARAALEFSGGKICAWSRSTDTIYIHDPAGGPGFYLKRYTYPTWTRRLRGALRGTFFGEHRAAAERRLLNEMRMLGIPAVRPVAFGVRRVAHFVAASFLITEEVPDAGNLTAFSANAASGRIPLTPRQRQNLCTALARQVAEVHIAGFSHGQLFWRNILVRIGPTNHSEFFFLDARPRRAGRWGSRRPEWWIDEIAHLAASALPFTTRTDRLRFLVEYFGTRRLSPDLRNLIRRIEQLAQRWKSHESSRIRMSRRFEEWNRKLIDEAAQLGAGGAT